MANDLRKKFLAAGLISCVSSGFVFSNSQVAFAMEDNTESYNDENIDDEGGLNPSLAKKVGLFYEDDGDENDKEVKEAVIDLLKDCYVTFKGDLLYVEVKYLLMVIV